MGVDTSTVQIRIDVVDQNSASTVKGVEQNIQQLGNAGAMTGDKVAAGMDRIHGHSLTALDNVRLLRDDIGIRIPRSMEKAIASSQFLMTGINAIGTGLLAIGAIDIGFRLVEGLKKAYDEYLSVGKAADDYYAEVAKHRGQDFSDTHAIEDTRARIAQVTDEIKRLDGAQRQISAHGFWMNPHVISDMVEAHEYSQAKFDRMKQADDLKARDAGQQHELTLAAIGRDHSSAGLSGEAARNANRDRRLAENEENQKYKAAQDGLLHNTTSSDAGAAERAIDDAKVRADAAGEAKKERLTQEQETMRMQADAREVNLRGEELYMDQRNLLLEQLKAKLIATELAPGEYRKREAAIDEKYENERLKRLDDQRRATEEMQGEAALAGFKGIGRTQAESDLAVGRIRGDRNLDDQTKGDRVAAEQNRLHFEILDQQRQFADEINSLNDSSAEHQVAGFARIRAEGTKQLDDLKRKFDEVYGQINRNAPGGEEAYQKGLGLLHSGQGAIGTSTADQISDLQRKNSEETSQLESQARSKMLSAERQQTAAIETEYEQRLRKFQDQLTQKEISENDYNRRVVASAELRDAEMVENARRAREKMAGEFTSFFHSLDHPTEALKNIGDKVAGQAAAALVQRAQNHFSGNGAVSNTTNPGDFMSSIFDRIAGKPHGAGAPPPLHATSDLAALKAISVATAQVHIQSANLSLGAAGIAGGPPSSSAGGSGSPRSSFNPPMEFPAAARGFGGGESQNVQNVQKVNFSGGGSNAADGGAGSPIGPGISDVEKGFGLVGQVRSIFGGGSGTVGSTNPYDVLAKAQSNVDMPDVQHSTIDGVFGPDGSFSSKGATNANGGMLGGGGIGANAGGAIGGALGLYSAYQGNGGIGGTLSGAASGMEFGMSLGGPVGAALGAVGGAILGAIGFGGKEKARVYDLKTVRPRIGADTMAYQAGSMDYGSAYSDMQSLDAEARKTLDAMGGSARAYYWDTINREIHQAEARLTAEQKAGRSQVTMSAAQFDIGADNIPRDGWAMLHQNERIIPSDQNERITQALEWGGDSSKASSSGQSTMPAQAATMGDIHFHVNAIDSRSVEKFFMQHGHKIRAALNASYAENSGGADA
jgi:hypothetical protein